MPKYIALLMSDVGSIRKCVITNTQSYANQLALKMVEDDRQERGKSPMDDEWREYTREFLQVNGAANAPDGMAVVVEPAEEENEPKAETSNKLATEGGVPTTS